MDLLGLCVSLKERALRLKPFLPLLISFIEMFYISSLKRTQSLLFVHFTSLPTYALSSSSLRDVLQFLSPRLLGKSWVVLRGVGGCGCESILSNWVRISPRMAGVVVIWLIKAKTAPYMLSSASTGTSSSPIEHTSTIVGGSALWGGKAGMETKWDEGGSLDVIWLGRLDVFCLMDSFSSMKIEYTNQNIHMLAPSFPS